MTYDEDMALRLKIFEAIRDAWGETPHAVAMRDQIARWFKRTWEPHPPAGGNVCALCLWQGPSFTIGRNGVRRFHDRTSGARIPICDECTRAAQLLLEDSGYPPRDMVRSDALRALRAIGADEAANQLDKLAAEYPDLHRAHGACSGCGIGDREIATGAGASLCLDCARTARLLEP